MIHFLAGLTSILSAAYITLLLAIHVMVKLKVNWTESETRQSILKAFRWCRPVFPVVAVATVVTMYLDTPDDWIWVLVSAVSYSAAIYLTYELKLTEERVEL